MDVENESTCRTVTQVGVEAYSKHVLYSTWRSMNYRCYSTVHNNWKSYGGAGITVCPEWRWDNPKGMLNFINDMGERPAKHTVDRVDPHGIYAPSNCRWADSRTQQNNFRKERDTESGHLGVVRDAETGKWKAQIYLNGKCVCINFFTELQDAIDAREEMLAVKMSLGDQEAVEFMDSQIDKTPKGARYYGRKTSQYYGVSWYKPTSKWRAATHTKVNGKLKQVHLGLHDTEEDAYSAVLVFLDKERNEQPGVCI